MKKLLLLALTAIMIVGCYKNEISTKEIVSIKDSCEYIIGSTFINGDYEVYVTHKGNCRFCTERRKQE